MFYVAAFCSAVRSARSWLRLALVPMAQPSDVRVSYSGLPRRTDHYTRRTTTFDIVGNRHMQAGPENRILVDGIRPTLGQCRRRWF